MERRISVEEYLTGEETNLPQELAFGFLREPAAPGYDHQVVLGRLHVLIHAHVRAHNLGRVVASPIDVVLDPIRALVVQPDLVFVASSRLEICVKHIAGPPDLVVEILSTWNRRHDRHVKVGWYRDYGVRECWVVDPVAQTVEVIDLPADGDRVRVFDGNARVLSSVLPGLNLRARDAFFD